MHPDKQMAVAAKFILQSPPGEINDVLNGIIYSDRWNPKITLSFDSRRPQYRLRRRAASERYTTGFETV